MHLVPQDAALVILEAAGTEPSEPNLEYRHKKVPGNTSITILVQAAPTLLGACFACAMGCTTAVQGAGNYQIS